MKCGAKALRESRMLETSKFLAEKGSGPEIGVIESGACEPRNSAASADVAR